MSAGKRKHVATGKKPPGGARKGAGRPEGSSNALPLHAIKAVEACKLRIPEKATPAQEQMATRALQRVLDVMEERVWFSQATNVLKAAAHVRAEVCGPLTQKHEVSGGITISVVDPYAEPGGEE